MVSLGKENVQTGVEIVGVGDCFHHVSAEVVTSPRNPHSTTEQNKG